MDSIASRGVRPVVEDNGDGVEVNGDGAPDDAVAHNEAESGSTTLVVVFFFPHGNFNSGHLIPDIHHIFT